MGVFLGDGDEDDINNAKISYLEGFFEALGEFYKKNPNAKLQKITFVIIEQDLSNAFKKLLKIFKRKNPEINLPEITTDISDIKFKAEECLRKNPNHKLGITMAPNGDQKFLGGILRNGNVLEEQVSALSDMASVGNYRFNPGIKQKIDLQNITTKVVPPTPFLDKPSPSTTKAKSTKLGGSKKLAMSTISSYIHCGDTVKTTDKSKAKIIKAYENSLLTQKKQNISKKSLSRSRY